MRRIAPLFPVVALSILAVLPVPAARAAGSPAKPTGGYDWSTDNSLTTMELTSVWGASDVNVFAVGAAGTVLHYDGANWAPMLFPDNVKLLDVFGTSAVNVYAIGGGKLYRYDGSTWSAFPDQPAIAVPRAIWGTSPTQLIVVGDGGAPGTTDTGRIAHYDGNQWTYPIPLYGYPRLSDVWGAAPNDVFAVSDETGAVYHYYACLASFPSWERVDVTSVGLRSVFGSSGSDVFSVAESGMQHFDGGPPGTMCRQDWTPIGPYGTYRGVWGDSPTNIYVVGYQFTTSTLPLVLHYDGTNWTPENTPPLIATRLNAVWGDGNGHVWAVGESGLVLRNTPGTPDTVLTVNSTAILKDINPGDGVCDTGRKTVNGDPECTLCAAIQEANAHPDADKIEFDIPTDDPGYRVATTSFEIAGAVPEIDQPVTIDGTTQPGYVDRPVIDLNLSGTVNGIVVKGGSTTIKSLVVRGSQGAGIELDGPGGNLVQGCYVGTDITGTAARGNRWGVEMNDSPDNTIGGVTAKERNLISGNSLSGVRVAGAGSARNTIVGNTIGLNLARTAKIANSFHGVHVTEGASATTIGGGTTAERNIISGNADHGVDVLDAADTRIVGNFIGVDGTGQVALGNSKGGIVVEGASTGTIVGGTGTGDGNVISGNNGDGVAFTGAGVDGATVAGNQIGMDAGRTIALANAGDGIDVDGAANVHIGDGANATGNTISDNQLYGVLIHNSTAHGVTLEHNRVGFASPDTVRAANGLGAIKVEKSATDVTIGGPNEDDWNRIFGFVWVADAGTKKIRFEGNDVVVPENLFADATIRMPFDLGGDGPNCSCWGGTGTGPNDGVAVPRILKIEPGVVEGMAMPNATVSIYRALAAGTGRNRYFARSIEAEAVGTADATGFFSIPVALSVGDRVVAAAADENGNASEITQLKRPVIFAHGIGGAWLVANDGTEVWLPDGATPQTQNVNLTRMGFNPDGTSKEPITAREMLESAGEGPAYTRAVYGPPVDYLATKGYAGDDRNANTAQLDLWRFWYDWRQSPEKPAQELKALVDQVTSRASNVARSCDVDIISHSNGVVVSSVYVRSEPDHSKCKVHRFVTVGGPVLGTPLAAGAHTRGYIFGLEEQNLYGHIFGKGLWVYWGYMIAMARNLPAAWALMPGKAYWNARTGPSSYYLEDLNGNPLYSHGATWRFMANPKTDGQGRPLGLDRNAAMWSRELSTTHAQIDDWRNFDGPPQVFRVVGKLPASTIERWSLTGTPPSRLRFPLQSQLDRWDIGDTYEHWAYREMIQPILGWGDGTVLLSSATLGHEPLGNTDYSGVGTSKWIEDFASFPCLHVPLVCPECESADKSISSLDYMARVLDSGYKVLAPIATPIVPVSAAAGGATELVYVSADAPIAVRVEDSAGGYTGPADPSNTASIDYLLPDVGYWSTSQSVCASIPNDQAYTLTVQATDATTVQVVRIVSDGNASNDDVLFPPTPLGVGGELRLVLDAGGTPLSTPLDLDATGDGSFEATVDPATTAASASTAPAIPRPQPFRVETVGYRGDAAPRQVSVHFPDTGGPVWTWNSSAPASWLNAQSLTGQAPDSLVLSFDASTLSAGMHSDTLAVTLSLGGYQTTMPVEVHALVLDSPSLARVEVSPDFAQLHPDDPQSFAAMGFDETNTAFSMSPNWTAEGGTIDATGLYTAGGTNGLYFITAHDASGSANGEAAVEIVGGKDPVTATLPSSFALHQNYPNPFNGGTTIVFDVKEPAHVRLKVYDVGGRLVATLADGDYGRGRFPVTFGNQPGLASGVYFYRIEMGSFSESHKMVHVK